MGGRARGTRRQTLVAGSARTLPTHQPCARHAGIRTGSWTEEEEAKLVAAHMRFGNKWSLIASCVEGRTENQIKNLW